MNSHEWVTKALASTPPGVFPWRAEMFAPAGIVQRLNRRLNELWNDQGDDLSVAMSPTGSTPVTFFAGSGLIDRFHLNGLNVALNDFPDAFALIRDGNDGPIIAALGRRAPRLEGRRDHIVQLAEMMGLRRMDSPVPALVPSAVGGSLLLQSVVSPIRETADGEVISVLSVPWMAIADEISRDPTFLARFAKNPRAFEEFLAGTYQRAGFDEVILTPRSGDRGRDVIATKRGFCSVRILDQAKAYSPGHVVTNDDVRAMAGVLWSDQAASKAAVTTTSDFAPSVFEEFKAAIPTKLELRNGDELRRLIAQMRGG